MCLLDIQTQTLLTFHSQEARHWSVEVRGNPHLWERVCSLYQQWVTLQRPAATAYHLVIDAQGKQSMMLPPSSALFPSFEWVLEEASPLI